jgi:N utilization substance protein B
VLYQVEQNPGMSRAEVRRFLARRLLGDETLCQFTEGLIAGVKERQAALDALISEVAENWRLDRMAAIDRNILRLGAYEMLHCPEVPAKVAINEALELAKRYSTAQSSRFVNGILDRLLQNQSRSQAAPQASSSSPSLEQDSSASASLAVEGVRAPDGSPTERKPAVEPPHEPGPG